MLWKTTRFDLIVVFNLAACCVMHECTGPMRSYLHRRRDCLCGTLWHEVTLTLLHNEEAAAAAAATATATATATSAVFITTASDATPNCLIGCDANL